MRNEQGMTLVEIIIGFALLSSAMVVAASSYTSISRLQQKGATVRQVQQSGRYALEELSRDIRSSGSLHLASAQCLSLVSTDPNQNTITYTYAGNQLYRNETAPGVATSCGAGGTVVTVGESRVSALTFVQPATVAPQKSFIIIDMDVDQPDASITDVTDPNKYTYHLSTTVTPRGF